MWVAWERPQRRGFLEENRSYISSLCRRQACRAASRRIVGRLCETARLGWRPPRRTPYNFIVQAAPDSCKLRAVYSASPREERIEVRRERIRRLPMLRNILFVILNFLGVSLTNGLDLPRDSDHDYDPPTPGSYALPVVKVAADGALLNSN